MKLLALVRCIIRLTRAAIWVIIALCLIPVLFVIPRSKESWSPGFHEQCVHLISRGFYRCFNVRIRYFGEPVTDGNMIIPNHISWIDILLLNGKYPFGFVAKAEVRGWPLFGAVGAAVGTLFINRDNKFSVYRSLPEGQTMLKRGQTLAVFAEGTTTIGNEVLPMFPMMFEIAVREKALVQPVALRYSNQYGELSEAAAFVGDDGFLQSLFRVAMDKVTYADVHFLPALNAGELTRKELALATQISITKVLESEIPTPVPTGAQPIPS